MKQICPTLDFQKEAATYLLKPTPGRTISADKRRVLHAELRREVEMRAKTTSQANVTSRGNAGPFNEPLLYDKQPGLACRDTESESASGDRVGGE